jgi:hypothetical protein
MSVTTAKYTMDGIISQRTGKFSRKDIFVCCGAKIFYKRQAYGGVEGFMSRLAFNATTYEIRPERCRIIRLSSVANVDTRRNDVFYANEMKGQLSGLFQRLIDDGADLSTLAVVVRLPKRVIAARERLGL